MRTHTTTAARLVLAALIMLLVRTPLAHAQNDKISVTAELGNASVYLGDTVILKVIVEGTDDADEPQIPEIPGIDIASLGGGRNSSTFAVFRNGRTERTERLTYIYQYSITPTREGSFQIPSISVPVGGRTYTTEPLRISAVEPPIDTDALLRLELESEEAYVGQPVRARVSWFFEGVANNASFRASELPASIDVLPLPAQAGGRSEIYRINAFGAEVQAVQTQGVVGSQTRPALVFEVMLIPRAAGEYQIGPVVVAFNRVQRRARRLMSRSEAPILSVRPVPSAGRPPGYTGLVGDYALALAASPTEINVGDPITLRLTVRGPEPLSSIDAPDLGADPDIAERFKPSADGWESIRQDRVGERTFETTIRARTADVDEIPPIRMPYFDPVSGEYRFAQTDPIPLEVRRTRRVTAADAIMGPGRAAPPSSRQLERGGDGVWALQTDPERLMADDGFDPAAWAANPAVVTMLAAPPAVYMLASVVVLARRRADPRRARRRRAISRARSLLARGEPSEAVRAWASGVRDMPSEAVTAADVLALGDKPTHADAALLAGVLLGGEASRFGSPDARSTAEPGKSEIRAAMTRLEKHSRATGAIA